mgnify:CR=1 FL=1
MNREKGVSSLALVLMLLILGSLLLQGMSQQDRSFASRVSMESQSLRRQAIVQSALAWGKMHSWQTQPAVQCSQYAGTDAQVCLRLLADNEALLMQFSAYCMLPPVPGFVCVYWQIMKPY